MPASNSRNARAAASRQLLVLARFSFRFTQTRAKVAQARHRFLRAGKRIEREVQLLVVRHTQQKIANRGRRKTFRRNVAKRVVVAFRLRHRFAVDFQMFEVNPVAHELFSGRAFALRDLVFVMRKDEIDAAGVNVEGFAEILHRHRRALDVPARTAATDRRVPGGFSFARRFFPEREVARVFFFVLVGIDAFAGAGDVSGEVDLRKLAVLRKRSDAVVDRVVRSIGVA